MKKYLFFLFIGLSFLISNTTNAQVSVQRSYAGWLGALDTLTNADTTTYTVGIAGSKSNITFQTNVLKISGTVAGTIKVYGSADGGTNYVTTALTSVTITDGSVNYSIPYTVNSYDHYKVQIITSGTQACSQRTRLLYRE